MCSQNDPAFVTKLSTDAKTLVGKLDGGFIVTASEHRVAEIERCECGSGTTSDRSATLPFSTLLQQLDGPGRIIYVEKSQSEVSSRPDNARLVVKRAVKAQALLVLLHRLVVVAHLFGDKAQTVE